MATSVKLRGFAELEKALVEELPKATAKNILRRTALNAMKPVEEHAKQLVPRNRGALAASITTKVVKAQRISRTKFAKSDGITVATGPTGRPEGGNAAWQEFGTVKQAAQPYMRPAADYEMDTMLDIVRDEMALQTDKARARIARKAAKGK